MFNQHSQRIASLIEKEVRVSEASSEPEVASRWLSIDPLQAKYPGWSPYNFTLNNPIIYSDPDGKDVELKIISSEKKGSNYTVKTAEIVITLTIVNPNNVDLSETMFSKSSGSLDVTKTFGGASTYRAGYADYDVNITKATIKYKVVSSIDKAGDNDQILTIVNNVKTGIPTSEGPTNANTVGLAEINGYAGIVEAGTLKNNTFNEVALHELGHTLGLNHTPKTLMNSNTSGKTNLTESQKGEMIKKTGTTTKGVGEYKKSAIQNTGGQAKNKAKEYVKKSN